MIPRKNRHRENAGFTCFYQILPILPNLCSVVEIVDDDALFFMEDARKTVAGLVDVDVCNGYQCAEHLAVAPTDEGRILFGRVDEFDGSLIVFAGLDCKLFCVAVEQSMNIVCIAKLLQGCFRECDSVAR